MVCSRFSWVRPRFGGRPLRRTAQNFSFFPSPALILPSLGVSTLLGSTLWAPTFSRFGAPTLRGLHPSGPHSSGSHPPPTRWPWPKQVRPKQVNTFTGLNGSGLNKSGLNKSGLNRSNWPEAVWPEAVLAQSGAGLNRSLPTKGEFAEVEIDRSRNWPKSKLAEFELTCTKQHTTAQIM